MHGFRREKGEKAAAFQLVMAETVETTLERELARIAERGKGRGRRRR